MSLAEWTPWLLEAATGGLAVWLWLQLLRIKRNVRGLVDEGKLNEFRTGPPVVRATLQDLYRLELRLREVGEQIADEAFSLQAILSSMLEGVMILDRQLHIQLINHRLQDMLLLARPPLGRAVMEVFRNHRLHLLLQRTLEGGSPQFEELQVGLREADRFITKHFQVTSVGLRPDREERFAGILLVFHDVSQIRELEAVRKEFVANVSHELRTPMAILSGCLETLLDDDVDPLTTRRFLETMHRHAERLNALLEDLLLLSQLEARRLPLHLETVTAKECFERVVDRFEPRIAALGASVAVSAPASLSFTADALRLEQALFNLVDNALKYGAQTTPCLTVAAAIEGEEVIISVADNGPGIPLRAQPHVFERFYRVHKDRSRDAGGTGLGLSIVKHIVQAHGGSVTLDSSPGNGATFVLRFPKTAKP